MQEVNGQNLVLGCTWNVTEREMTGLTSKLLVCPTNCTMIPFKEIGIQKLKQSLTLFWSH
jgi:hypothetical protein